VMMMTMAVVMMMMKHQVILKEYDCYDHHF
jgi:hypothetical protein